jgi:hypothetical protein
MAIDSGTLNALYKVAYSKGVVDLIPATGKISQMIPFVPSELQNGKQYEQPVVLSAEAGFTYSLDTQNAYDLNESVGMNMQSAIVPGCDIVLDSTVGYNQAARASHSSTSFKSAMSMKFENMLKSTEKRLEIAMLYGGKAIGTAPLQSVGSPTTSLTFTVSTASWASGIWTGSENANIVFAYSADDTAVDSLRSFKISAVNDSDKSITVVVGTAGTPGTISTLETAIEAHELNIYFYGTVSGTGVTFAHSDMSGFQAIISNTGSLFGIDAATYDLWQGNTFTTSGQLTMAKVLKYVAACVQRGLDVDAALFVNPNTWADLASNLAALRRYDGSYSKKKSANGSEVLEYVSQNGAIEIVPYNLVKEGDAFLFPKEKVMRIGARDLGLNDPTRPEDEIFFTIPGKAGVGLRAYTNQALFVEAPAQCAYISGIVNSAA